MKVSFLTSGFPNGFPVEFINCIKEYYHNNGTFVLIASDFTAHQSTDHYTELFINMFKTQGISFSRVQIIDDRINQKAAVDYINQADIIWIAGGDTLKQIGYIKDYHLIQALQKRDGITIGMSAGSINMAKRVVLAKDINDNIPELSIYDGIGLVEINVEPHIDSASQEHMKDIDEASQFASIYGICDNSFIKVENDTMKIYGTYFKYEK